MALSGHGVEMTLGAHITLAYSPPFLNTTPLPPADELEPFDIYGQWEGLGSIWSEVHSDLLTHPVLLLQPDPHPRPTCHSQEIPLQI